MRCLLVLVVSLGLSGFHLSASTGEPRITPEIALQAISIYRENPVGEQADAALSIIVDFARASPRVLAVIEERVFPFQFDTINSETESRFVGAFLAGNVEYQLIHRVKENRPYEGILLMIFAYEAMRRQGLVNRIAGFEGWINLRDNGELKAIIDR